MRRPAMVLAFCAWVIVVRAADAAADQPAPAPTASATPAIVEIDARPQRRIQTFRPLDTLGSTVDKEPAGSIPWLYSKANVQQMLGAGWGWLSYRLFTELSDQDWHWNPAGSFTDGNRGYWKSSASTRTQPVADSSGYRLERRGNSTDQGNNADYSRLDDGRLRTFWKSDPYLTSRFTGDPDDAHPQWIVVDLGSVRLVDALVIDWSNPYAKRYAVAFWTGDDPINDPANGAWRLFPRGSVTDARGGRALLRLAATPLHVRYVRIAMTQSSNTCDADGPADPRNCVGYAVAEVGVGTFDDRGRFHDAMIHVPCSGDESGPYRCYGHQTIAYTSSTDPWHRASDRVLDQEQPGLDLIARSGLTRGRPAVYPVPMLYSTPENAVAEIRYLEARRYALAGVEIGEEPDGQYTLPEDYAALFVQWARAVHAVDPSLKLGGPVFSGVNAELQTWRDAHGNASWLNRFLTYLRMHHAMDQLAFMSFEHYPFNGCEHGDALFHDLLVEPSILKTVIDAWRADGLPSSTPMYITEANFSAVNFTQTPMQVEGALWQADYMAGALSDGVARVVYYQYEPVPLSQNTGCPSDWGNLTMFAAGDRGDIHARTAQYFAGLMLTQQWVQPGNAPHGLYPAVVDLMRDGNPLISAYAVKRPDGRWSLLLINKDTVAHDITVRFDLDGGRAASFAGTVAEVTFGSAQYAWQQAGAASHPQPDGPPQKILVEGPAFTLPATSITVLRGRIGG